jgi:hypothetical protein
VLKILFNIFFSLGIYNSQVVSYCRYSNQKFVRIFFLSSTYFIACPSRLPLFDCHNNSWWPLLQITQFPSSFRCFRCLGFRYFLQQSLYRLRYSGSFTPCGKSLFGSSCGHILTSCNRIPFVQPVATQYEWSAVVSNFKWDLTLANFGFANRVSTRAYGLLQQELCPNIDYCLLGCDAMSFDR